MESLETLLKRSDRNQATELIDKLDPEWIIGAPPCTPRSIWNYAMNYPKINKGRVRTLIAEGRVHFNCVCSLYRRQVERGKLDLHQHPATALSWKEDVIDSLARHPLAHVVVGHQSQYGLVTPSAADKTKMLLHRLLHRPTRFLTNSKVMADQLCKKCPGKHTHQPLEGGRCRDAALYPSKLVRAILKGISLQAQQQHVASMVQQEEINTMNMMCGIPLQAPKIPHVDFGEAKKSSIPRMSGGSVPIIYAENNFRSKYVDEYTGEILPPHLIRDAIIDELDYFNDKVWQLSTVEEMKKVPDYILVRSRWVLCNKGDSSDPDVRAHLVSCEINIDGKHDAFAASTPPLEA